VPYGIVLVRVRVRVTGRADPRRVLRGAGGHGRGARGSGSRVGTLSPSLCSPGISSECAYLHIGVQVGALGSERLHHRYKTVLCSVMEGRLAILRGGVERAQE